MCVSTGRSTWCGLLKASPVGIFEPAVPSGLLKCHRVWRRYVAEPCQDYKMHGLCVLGKECPFAHGVFEINLHPSKYRTQVSAKASQICQER